MRVEYLVGLPTRSRAYTYFKEINKLKNNTIGDLVKQIRLKKKKTEPSNIMVEGVAFPIHLYATYQEPSEPAPLVIFFHGAIRRETRAIPVFEGRFTAISLAGKANVVSIADPTLSMSASLRTTWYAGAQDYDVPKALRTLIKKLVDELKPSRTIICGGSTGAHPALYQTSFLSEGVAIVCNPIGHISHYFSGHIRDYRNICWPKIGADIPLKDFVADVAVSKYKENSSSTVIILSNARDHHLTKQSAPLKHILSNHKKMENTMLVSSFFSAHSGHSYSSLDWLKWISAAVASPSISVADIGMSYEKLKNLHDEESGLEKEVGVIKPKKFSHEDIMMAQNIYEYKINGSEE